MSVLEITNCDNHNMLSWITNFDGKGFVRKKKLYFAIFEG